MTEAGYTVFVINHRAAPTYTYPAQVEDAQRAVRFVRHNAAKFGIRPDRIGGVGGSSGGHLISMLGVLDGNGNSGDPDPVERQSAKLQAVMARAAPTDLTRFEGRIGSASVASLIGLRLMARDRPNTLEHRTYWEASPAAHVSPDDPPFLLMHGDADDRVPYVRSVEFSVRLQNDGIKAELITIAGGGHGATFPGARNPPDYLGAMVRFFNEELLSDDAKQAPAAPSMQPDPRVERNISFGMVSGGALLMDVHKPENPNGYGVVHITGSGWHSPLAPSAPQQKSSRQVLVFGIPLVEAGYTVFAINHRTAPLHKYPAQLHDVERAVRFIRHHADRWSIDPDRIGGVAGSSGGHMTLMLGLLSSTGDPEDPDPVNRGSARLQTIVPWAAPTDLVAINGTYGIGTMASLFGMRLMARDAETTFQHKAARDASPIRHVSDDDPPKLLIHGDADMTVPLQHSVDLLERLEQVGGTVELIVVPNGGHGATFPGKTRESPDYIRSSVEWFDRHLWN